MISKFDKMFYEISHIVKFHKLAYMTLLIFFILLTHNILKVLKDSLIIVYLGPETISFIKLWLEIPIGTVFVLLYNKMYNKFNSKTIFNITVIFFLIFFFIFSFFLFPNRHLIHLSDHEIITKVNLSPHFQWLIIIINKWSFVGFYILCELWPIIVFSLLFWELMNRSFNSHQAKYLYPIINLFGQISIILSGLLIGYIINLTEHIEFKGKNFSTIELTLKTLTSIAEITGVITLILYSLVNSTNTSFEKKISSISLSNSLITILNSKYLIHITLTIICYNIAVNLIECIWFSMISKLYTTPSSVMSYQAKISFWVGIVGVNASIVFSIVIRKFNWLISAITTPLITLIIGVTFLILVLIEIRLEPYMSISIAYKYLTIVVFCGGLQNIFIKSIKYSFFDVTKEMLYIPLEGEIKTKGKAAVDILGTKFGKALGSSIQVILLSIIPFAKIESIILYLTIVFLITCLTWLYATIKLSKMYNFMTTRENL